MIGQRASAALERAREIGQPICLDTSALLAFLLDEPAAAYVASIINDKTLSVLISTISLAEIGVRPASEGDDGARAIVRQVLGLPALSAMPVDNVVALEAAHVRARTRLRIPDAVVIATARVGGAVALVGNDRQWRTRQLGVPFFLLDDLVA